jgi:Cystatin domain
MRAHQFLLSILVFFVQVYFVSCKQFIEKTIQEVPDAEGRIYNPQPGRLDSMPGGWSAQDTHDKGVQKAAKFACDNVYKKENYKSFRVITAQTQVVAGINYKLVVDVTFPDDGWGIHHCREVNFVVYDHFGDLSVSSHEETILDCLPPDSPWPPVEMLDKKQE